MVKGTLSSIKSLTLLTTDLKCRPEESVGSVEGQRMGFLIYWERDGELEKRMNQGWEQASMPPFLILSFCRSKIGLFCWKEQGYFGISADPLSTEFVLENNIILRNVYILIATFEYLLNPRHFAHWNYPWELVVSVLNKLLSKRYWLNKGLTKKSLG